MEGRSCATCARPARTSDIFCDACAPVAANHVVSMQIDQQTGDALAVCPCGWTMSAPWTKAGRLARDRAVLAHWVDAVSGAGEAR